MVKQYFYDVKWDGEYEELDKKFDAMESFCVFDQWSNNVMNESWATKFVEEDFEFSQTEEEKAEDEKRKGMRTDMVSAPIFSVNGKGDWQDKLFFVRKEIPFPPETGL